MRGRWRNPSLMRSLLPALLALMLSGCQTTPTGGTRVACAAFGPITYADADTPETIDQIVGHNAAWDAICR